MKQVYGLISEHSLDIGSKRVGTWLSNYTNIQWGLSEAKSIQQSLVNTCASIGRIFFVQKDDTDERWFASCVRIHSEYIITCTPMDLENYVTSNNLKMYAIFSFNGNWFTSEENKYPLEIAYQGCLEKIPYTVMKFSDGKPSVPVLEMRNEQIRGPGALIGFPAFLDAESALCVPREINTNEKGTTEQLAKEMRRYYGKIVALGDIEFENELIECSMDEWKLKGTSGSAIVSVSLDKCYLCGVAMSDNYGLTANAILKDLGKLNFFPSFADRSVVSIRKSLVRKRKVYLDDSPQRKKSTKSPV